MRIPHDQYGQALRGEKTLHLYPRRPLTPKPFKIGHSYPIKTVRQEDNRRIVSTERFRVRVVALGRTPVHNLPPQLVQMAGWENPDELADWWQTWHGARDEAWLVWFIAIEKPRFPASTARNRHDDHGYTTIPLPGDDTLEAPPEQWVERQADICFRRDDQLRRAQAEALLAQRAKARSRAKRTQL